MAARRPDGRRRFGWVHSFRCTECNALLLNLWRELPDKGEWEAGRWVASEPTPCRHVTAEQIEVYRYTKRNQRDELELPITAGRGRLRGKATRPPAAGEERPPAAA